MSSKAEQQYEEAMDAFSPKERVGRSMAMLKWSREAVSRQILAEMGPMSSERLKLEVAKWCYGSDSALIEMIDRVIANVPR